MPSLELYQPIAPNRSTEGPDACALAAVVSPVPLPATEVLKILERMDYRGGPLGGGFALKRWNQDELSSHGLTPDPNKNYHVITAWSYNASVTLDILEAKLRENGVVTLLREEIPTDPSALNALGLSSRPQSITRYIATVEDPGTRDSSPDTQQRKEFDHLQKTVAMLQKTDFPDRQILVPSFTQVAGGNRRGIGGGMEVFKGVGTAREIFGFYKELADIKSDTQLGHARFPTTSQSWWGGSHPFQQGEWIAIHNGNIISYDVHVEALKKGYYALSAGTDSEAVPAMVDYLTRVKGLPIEVAFLALRSPQWSKRTNLNKEERLFVDALNLTYDDMMPDGPTGLILTNGKEVYALTGRHGVRPIHITRTDDGVVRLASELGPISDDGAKPVSFGKVDADSHFVVYQANGRIRTKKVTVQDVIHRTVRKKEFPDIENLYHKVDLRKNAETGVKKSEEIETERKAEKVHKALLESGFSPGSIRRVEKEARKGSVIIESQGETKPLSIFRGKNARFLSFFQIGASEVGDPSIDPDRMPIDTVTHLGKKAGSITEVPEVPYDQVIVNSPFVLSARYIPKDWTMVKEVLEKTARTFGTAILDGTGEQSLPPEMLGIIQTKFENDFEGSISGICQQVESQIQAGRSIIVLSDIVESAQSGRDVIPATLVVRLVDKYLREKNLRHMASLVVESLEIASSPAAMKTLALGADSVSIDPRIILAAMGIGKYGLNTDPLLSLPVNPPKKAEGASEEDGPSKEELISREAHARAHNLFTSWMHQLKKLMGGADLTDLNNLRGNRSLLQSIGLGGNTAGRLGIADDGVGRRNFDFFIRNDVTPFTQTDENDFDKPQELPGHNSDKFAAALRKYARTGASLEPARTDYFDLLEFKKPETSKGEIKADDVSLQTKLFPQDKLGRVINFPVVFGAASLGATVINYHKIVGDVASEQGTFYNTGEGGRPLAKYQGLSELANEIRKDEPDVDIFQGIEELIAKKRYLSDDHWTTFQVASGRWGNSLEVLRHSGVIEIKIAQGAKPGIGGHLPGKKNEELTAATRGIPQGSSVISPATHQDITSIEDLRALVSLLRETTDGKTPIQVKLAALPGMVWIAVGAARCGVDAIVIDGFRGSTGAAPWAQQNEVGLPIATAIAAVDDALRKEGIRDKVSLIGGGGLRTVKEYLMMVALGADAAMIVTPLMQSMGCIHCCNCHEGECPVGQTAQMGTIYEQRLDYTKGKKWLTEYIEQVKKDMRLELAGLGLNSINDLRGRRDLLELIDSPDIIAALDPSAFYENNQNYSGLASPLVERKWVNAQIGRAKEVLEEKIPKLLSIHGAPLDIFDAVNALEYLVRAGSVPGATSIDREFAGNLLTAVSEQMKPILGKSRFAEYVTGVKEAFMAKDEKILSANLTGLHAINTFTQKLDLDRICGCTGECMHRKPVGGTAQKLVEMFEPLRKDLMRAETTDQEPIILDLRHEPMTGDRYVGVALSRMVDELREANPNMIRPLEVRLEGQAGHGLGTLLPWLITMRINSDGKRITGAGDGIGTSNQGGEIIIEGNGGDATGYAMRKGGIYIKGNVDDLAGCNMRGMEKGIDSPRIVIGGGVKNRAFEGIAGGIGIVIGHNLKPGQQIIGNNFASGVFGGTIFVHASEDEVKKHIHPDHLKNLNMSPIVTENEETLKEELVKWCLEFGVKWEDVGSGQWIKISSNTRNPFAASYAEKIGTVGN